MEASQQMNQDGVNELIIDKQSLILPPATLGVTVSIIVFGVLSLMGVGFLKYFVLHPLSLLPPRFWVTTLLTYPFIDYSAFNLIITIVSFPVFGKVLENLYGPAAFLRYLFTCIIVTALFLVLVGMFEPLFVRDVEKWSQIPQAAYFGFQPALMACFVALKQTMPETEIAIFFLFRVKLKNLPIFALSLTLAVSVVLPSRGAFSMLMALPVSWFYLRYFSTLFSQGSNRGDMRDAFSFASFFPPQFADKVAPISRWLDARRCWPSNSSASLPMVNSLPLPGAEVDSRVSAASAAATTSHARENRAIATDLINSRLESIERSGGPKNDTLIKFDDADQSFVEVTPAKKLDFSAATTDQ